MRTIRNIMKYAAGIAALGMLTTQPARSQGFDAEWALGASIVAPNGTATYTRTFQGGTTYDIIADGAEGALDVDLYVQDTNGRTLVSDTRSNKQAQVSFRPSRTGTYRVVVKLASAYRSAVCTVLFINRDDGWYVPPTNMSTVLERHLAFALTIDALGHTPNIVRFYGWVMRPGEERTMDISGLERKTLLAIARGDNFATDIDLYVRRGGLLLAYDVDRDARPTCLFTGSSSTISITVKHVSGTGPSFIVLGIYE